MEAEPIFSSSQESVGNLFDCNLPSNYLNFALASDEPDPDDGCLAAALQEAQESGSITPLVKQELKLLIQSRRLSQGKDELKVVFAQPPTGQLTQAEVDRRLRRKDQNRRAAKRFRKNKKLRECSLLEEISMLQTKNEGLQDRITQLQRLKDSLMQQLIGHVIICPSFPPLLPGRNSNPTCVASYQSLSTLPRLDLLQQSSGIP